MYEIFAPSRDIRETYPSLAVALSRARVLSLPGTFVRLSDVSGPVPRYLRAYRDGRLF